MVMSEVGEVGRGRGKTTRIFVIGRDQRELADWLPGNPNSSSLLKELNCDVVT